MIALIDGDAFFASVEQALHPEYMGKPLVAGRDRGIAAAISYEAKKYGIKRGMPIMQVRRLCPECIVVMSDYHAYELFSNQILKISRQHSPLTERYSIDEVFIDVPQTLLSNISPYQFAKEIQNEVESALAIPVSIGIASTKSLAKLASNFQKPHGCVYVDPGSIPSFLQQIPITDVWGIGRRLSRRMRGLGVLTAYDLYSKDVTWMKGHFSKPEYAIWEELHGIVRFPVDASVKETYQSIQKVRTFGPPSSDSDYVGSQLMRNIENAWYKMYSFGLQAKGMNVFLKKQDLSYRGLDFQFVTPTDRLDILLEKGRMLYKTLYKARVSYRATGVTLWGLTSRSDQQVTLWDDLSEAEKIRGLQKSIYDIKYKYGRTSLIRASSLGAVNNEKQYTSSSLTSVLSIDVSI